MISKEILKEVMLENQEEIMASVDLVSHYSCAPFHVFTAKFLC